MNPRSWSLAERLTRWFALSSAAFVLLITAISAWYVELAIRQELERRVTFKLDQAQSLFSFGTHEIGSFEVVATELSQERFVDPMAWVVWDADTNQDLSEFGHREMLAGLSLPKRTPDRTFYLGGGRVWRVEPLFADKRVGLLLDGSEHVRLLYSFLLMVLAAAAVVILVAIVCARKFGRKVAGMLEEVARSTRTVRSSTDTTAHLDTLHAPREIRAVAEALKDMLASIECEAEKARLIVAGLAHELRSPIQNLLGETDVALLRTRTSEEYRAVLKSHLDELRDLARVVDNLVLLCASQDASRARELEGFDLGTEAELRLSKDRDRAHQEGLHLELARLGDLHYYGDREALLLALRNLVTNALKWSPAGGTVRVQLHGEHEAILFLVDDAGPGVPPTLRERVFEPFFQGPALRGRRAGYGLGLALTRSAVVAHGGTITIEESPLGGARFRVVLPRVRRPQHQDVA